MLTKRCAGCGNAGNRTFVRNGVAIDSDVIDLCTGCESAGEAADEIIACSTSGDNGRVATPVGHWHMACAEIDASSYDPNTDGPFNLWLEANFPAAGFLHWWIQGIVGNLPTGNSESWVVQMLDGELQWHQFG